MRELLSCLRFPLNKMKPLTVLLLFFSSAVAVPVSASDGLNGAALYHKHCQGCHPDASKLKTKANIIVVLRNPPPLMPAFSQNKINDRDTQKIGDFILHGAENSEETPEPQIVKNIPVSVTSVSVPVEPEKKPEDKTTPDTPEPVVVKQAKPQEVHKPKNTSNVSDRRFARKWTIKRIRNNETEILQTFEIITDENHAFTAVPLVKMADYTLKVTALEISGKTVKMEFTTTWKYSSAYLKIETFKLVMSDDGKKMNGTYTVHVGGSTSPGQTVWAE